MSTTEPSIFAEDSTTTLNFFDVSIGPSTFQAPGVNESDQNSEFEPNDCLGMLTASQSWSEVCEGILSIIVGICGLFGNAATVAVLSKPVFKETFHKLLICLACFDSLFIGSAIVIYPTRAFGLYKTGSQYNQFIHYLFMVLFPIANIALCGSIYITAAVSIERFLGVVYPIRSRTRRRNMWYYLVPVLLLAIGFNIPKALEIRVNVVEDEAKNETFVQAAESDLARDLAYAYYYKVWSNLIVTAVVPMAVLIFCNVSIFCQMRKSRKEMQSSRHQRTTQQNNEENGGGQQNQCQSADYNLAMILAGIVIVFCVCHSLRVFLAFYYVSVVERTNQCTEKGEETSHPFRLYIISALNHLMLMVNSSINFIIYCAVGSKFRKVLKDKFFPASMRSSSGALRTNQIEIQQLNGHVMNRPSPRKETQIELREDHEDKIIQVVTAATDKAVNITNNGIQTVTRVYSSSNNQTKTCSSNTTDL